MLFYRGNVGSERGSMIDVSNNRGRQGLGFYQEYHYVPTDKEKSGTVLKTLQYSYDG